MATVRASTVPMYLQGCMPPIPHVPAFLGPTVRASEVPMYLEGWRAQNWRTASLQGWRAQDWRTAPHLGFNPAILIGPVVVSKTQGTASSALESAAAGAAQGAKFGPIGAAIGAIAGAIAGIFGSHAARAQSAKTEDAAMNEGVAAFDKALKALNAALKSGQIDANGALQVAQQNIVPGYWTVVAAKIQPGRNGCNTGSSCPPGTPGKNPCQGNIGAACCVGCYDLMQSLSNPDGVFAALAGQSVHPAGPYVSRLAPVNSSKYGGQARSEYTLDWTPPAAAVAAAGTAGAAVDALTAPVAGTGVPGWMILAGAAAAMFALKG